MRFISFSSVLILDFLSTPILYRSHVPLFYSSLPLLSCQTKKKTVVFKKKKKLNKFCKHSIKTICKLKKKKTWAIFMVEYSNFFFFATDTVFSLFFCFFFLSFILLSKQKKNEKKSRSYLQRLLFTFDLSFFFRCHRSDINYWFSQITHKKKVNK